MFRTTRSRRFGASSSLVASTGQERLEITPVVGTVERHTRIGLVLAVDHRVPPLSAQRRESFVQQPLVFDAGTRSTRCRDELVVDSGADLLAGHGITLPSALGLVQCISRQGIRGDAAEFTVVGQLAPQAAGISRAATASALASVVAPVRDVAAGAEGQLPLFGNETS